MMSRGARIGIFSSLLALIVMVALLAMSTHGVRVLPSAVAGRTLGTHGLMTDCGTAQVAPASALWVGVALGGSVTQQKIDSFAHAAGAHPAVVESYRQMGRPFSWNLACRIARNGALPLIDIDPKHQTLSAIAAGRYDSYLTAYAERVKAFKLRIAISFGHEMNGNWYSWGWTHSRPAAFIKAWQHIHDVFARAGAENVVWVWTVVPSSAGSSPPAMWWPGSAYVTWVGVDDYYRHWYSGFGTITGALARIRAFTHKPVLITETAVSPRRDAAKQVASLFLGVESHPGILGFIWFDEDRTKRWRLQGDKAASQMFRQEYKAFG